MRIKVVNPNTTQSMTATIVEAARQAAAPGTEIVGATSSTGPVSIEGHYDEALAALGLLQEIRHGEDEGCDGYVIACFGDPGLHPASPRPGTEAVPSAGMADLARDLSAELGVPVIDGVGAAVKFIEALVSLGLSTSKRGDLAFPIAKPYLGPLAPMSFERKP